MRRVVRTLAPHWTRHALAGQWIEYERYAPVEAVREPPGRRVLVLAPHPDDESIGCGGAIALYRARNVPVHVAFLTDGRIGDPAIRDLPAASAERRTAEHHLAQQRQAEALQALQVLGVTGWDFFGAPDGGLIEAVDTVVGRLADLLRRYAPDTVLLPFLTDRHPDHFAANRCLLMAGAIAGDAATSHIDCLGYEIWSPIYANLVVDIGAVFEIKRRAIACHASQLAKVDLLAGVEGLNCYRAVSSLSHARLAEAYFRANWAAYRRLHAALQP